MTPDQPTGDEVREAKLTDRELLHLSAKAVAALCDQLKACAELWPKLEKAIEHDSIIEGNLRDYWFLMNFIGDYLDSKDAVPDDTAELDKVFYLMRERFAKETA